MMSDAKKTDSRENDSEKERKLSSHDLCTAEGKVFLVGLWILCGYVTWLSLSFLWDPGNAQYCFAMTATHILFGRAAGMSFGYAVGLSNALVVLVNCAIETILVLLFYPLFVFSLRHLIVFRFLKDFISRIQTAAEKNRNMIRRWGIPGLLVFVWFPFWMTGPLVGCFIGYLLGIRLVVNLAVVLLGTYCAIGSWAYFLRQLHDRFAEYSPYAPLGFVSAVILIIAISHFLLRVHKKKEKL